MTDRLDALLEEYHSGFCTHAHTFLGCHPERREGVDGFVFRVWAPNAQSVQVVGDFNFWNPEDLPMQKRAYGVWEAWSAVAEEGSAYKYLVRHWDGHAVYKADPVGFRTCRQPDTSSMISVNRYVWHDAQWLATGVQRNPVDGPLNIYEVHLGSWRRKPDGNLYSYAELAPLLAQYVREMGYTHVELMPLCEYPFDPSWGYQVTHYYAPTSRYGSPQELMELVDTLHQAGIGVLLDWVPAHFPKDEYGLYEFDGGCTYESSDPLMNEHAEWGTRIFDFGKPEVRNFLISNAVYWLEEFHFDGLRVDAVSAMLYLDYSRPNYRPNRFGGRENLEAIEFLRQLNRACSAVRDGIVMVAEESTTFPLVTRPEREGGLGFGFKWNMGWMNDTLRYMKEDPLFRKYQHNLLTFSMTYAFAEHFVLPLSHDEVVYGKGSLIGKMPGESFWKFANLRVLRGYQMAHPGKKLCFMGGEFAQFTEWNFQRGLDWMLLDFELHQKMQSYYKALNHFYLEHEALWDDDLGWDGYQWIQPDDGENSILAFRRIGRDGSELIAVLNFTPVLREDYRLGLPYPGVYRPVFCSDEPAYGGTGNLPGDVSAEELPFRSYSHSGRFRVPPMSLTFYVGGDSAQEDDGGAPEI